MDLPTEGTGSGTDPDCARRIKRARACARQVMCPSRPWREESPKLFRPSPGRAAGRIGHGSAVTTAARTERHHD